MPPNDIELEEAIIGCLLVDKDAYTAIAEILKAEHFYNESNKLTFEAIKLLNDENKPIDLLTVSDKLRSIGTMEQVGGAYKLSQSMSRVGNVSSIEYHARIIFEFYLRRTAIMHSALIQSIAFDLSIDLNDLFSDILTMEDRVVNFASESRQISNFIGNVTESINQVKIRSKNALNNITNGIPSKLNCINAVTNGYKGDQLIVIAGRPGMGKTAFAICEAKFFAQKGFPVMFFSLEMSSISLTDRVIIAASGIDSKRFKSGKLSSDDWQLIDNCYEEIKELPIFIDDTPYVSLNHIRRLSKVYHQRGKCKAIFIDYLQLANMDGGVGYNREQEVASMSRKLKGLAKELNVPIFLLSQLSRKVEDRAEKKPMLSDLRESGAIEQDADIVMFPMRPEYYDKEDESLRNLGYMIIAKHRDGETGEFPFKTNQSVSNFYDIDEYTDKQISHDPNARYNNDKPF